MTEHGKPPLTRRAFLHRTAAAAVTGYSFLRPGPLLANQASRPVPRPLVELDATHADGIDLVIERTAHRVNGRTAEALTINGSLPGPVLRMKEGREAVIRVHNRLDESTSIHWHGILLPFTMDGVPGISYPGIAPHSTFVYRYRLHQSGTYWYHSHSGLQEQLGHYGMLIVDPADEDPVAYDVEYPIVLSDWTFEDPHAVLRKLKTFEGYYNFQRPTLANVAEQSAAAGATVGEVLKKRLAWQRMRMDPTDLADVTAATYTYLINGQSPAENPTLVAKPGQRVRLRIVNASAMTYFDFRVPGLPMTVVQADGQDVQPVETDELRIAVAETYDVIVTLPQARAYTLFAETMDRSGFARATLAPQLGMSAPLPERRPRPMLTMADMGMLHDKNGGHGGGHKQHSPTTFPATHAAAATSSSHELATENLPERFQHPPERHGPGSIGMGMVAYRQLDDPGSGLGNDGWRVLTYGQLQCLRTPRDRRPPTREIDLHLTGNMHKYIWGFNGKKWSEADMLRFEYGERLRINMINDTMMSHPIHLHGMWMDLYAGGRYDSNPRKHTVNVQPAELLTVDITVDAPGQWAFHCHLLYHMKMGMFRTVAVVRSLSGGATHDGS